MMRPVVAGITVALLLWALSARALAQEPDPHAHHTPPQEAKPLPDQVPPLTEADRAAAFPDVPGHAANDDAVNFLVLFDQFEWQRASGANGFNWDNKGWIGKDTTRLWFRTEGESEDGALSNAHADVLFGRSIARWWDIVAGVRQDVRPGSPQTWAAFGVQGLAPYWFEIEATGYVGASGRTRARLEVEYELLLTNRLILQPLVQLDFDGKDDPARGVSAGLSNAETGLRLRYEIRRELAPYIGLTWQKGSGTSDSFSTPDGEKLTGVTLAAGVRWWF
jgi:copper resistance protein B